MSRGTTTGKGKGTTTTTDDDGQVRRRRVLPLQSSGRSGPHTHSWWALRGGSCSRTGHSVPWPWSHDKLHKYGTGGRGLTGKPLSLVKTLLGRDFPSLGQNSQKHRSSRGQNLNRELVGFGVSRLNAA